MNKIFKNVWNHIRGQIVCVSENSSSHDRSTNNEIVGSVVNHESNDQKNFLFVKNRIALAVMGLSMSIQPVMAAIDYNEWLQEPNQDRLTLTMSVAGGTYGHIKDWTHSWDTTQKTVVTFEQGSRLTTGVYGIKGGKFYGELGKTGLLRHWAVINKGTLEDSTDAVNGHAQVGSTNWIHKFANTATGSINVFDLRSNQVLNESENFKVNVLHLQAGGELQNSGTINVSNELRVGVADKAIFDNNKVAIDPNQQSIILPTVQYDDANSHTVLNNSGTINANQAYVAGKLNNAEHAVFNVQNNLTVTQAVENKGHLNALSATLEGLTNTSNSQLQVTNDLTVNQTVNNQGKLEANTAYFADGLTNAGSGENGKINVDDMTVVGMLTNTGTVSATQSIVVDQLVNGTLDVSGQINSSGTLTVKSDFQNAKMGRIEVGQLSADSLSVTNNGEIVLTKIGEDVVSKLGTLDNKNLIRTSHDVQVTSLNNEKDAKIIGAGKLTVSENMTNNGHIGSSNERLKHIVISGKTINDGKIYAEEMSTAGLTNNGTISVENILSSGTSDDTVVNTGELTAGYFNLKGTFNNTNSVISQSNNQGSNFDTVNNSGTIKANHNLVAVNLSNNENGTINVVNNLTTQQLNNSGHIGSDTDRVNRLIVDNGVAQDASAINAGSIYVKNAEFRKNLQIDKGGLLDASASLSFASVENSGAIVAKSITAAGHLNNLQNSDGKHSTLTTDSLLVTEKLSNAGELNVNQTLTAQNFDNSGIFNQRTDISGKKAEVTNEIANSGVMNLTTGFKSTSLNNQGSAEIKGTGSIEIANLVNNGNIGIKNQLLDLNVTETASNNKNITVVNAEFNQLTNSGNILVSEKFEATGNFENQQGAQVSAKYINLISGSNNGSIDGKEQITIGNTNSSENQWFDHQSGDFNAKTLLLGRKGKLKLSASANSVTIGTLKSYGGEATLENERALVLGSIGNVVGMTYTQTNGSLRVEDNTFFKNSTININGGELIRTAVGANTLGQGNTIVLSGKSQPSFGPDTDQPLGDNWRNGLTYVHVGLLNSDSNVTIDSGALLEADQVKLTDKTLTLNGGVLASKLGSFFVSTSEDFFTIDSGDAHKLPTTVLGTKDVGALNQSFQDNLTVTGKGGTLVLTDDYVYTQAIKSANQAFQTAFEGTNVVFTGQITDPSTKDNKFYLDTFNALKSEQPEDSKFNTPGLVFSNMVYVNKQNSEDTVAHNRLVVGNPGSSTDGFNLTQNIGFMSVEDADVVVVQDGMTFTLTGNTSEPGIDLVNDANGKVQVTGAGSLFNLGNQGVIGVKGNLGTLTVENNGKFKTVKGTYKVNHLQLSTGGTGEVAKDAVLNVNNYNDDAELGTALTNHGVLNLAQNDAVITTVFNNDGEFNATGSNTTLKGNFNNTAEGLAKFQFVKFDSSTQVNEQNAKIVTENGFNLASESEMTNHGRLVSYGNNDINGQLNVESTGFIVAQGQTNFAASEWTMSGQGLFGTLNLNQGSAVLNNNGVFYVEKELNVAANSELITSAGSVLAVNQLNVVGSAFLDPKGEYYLGQYSYLKYNADKIKGEDYRQNPAQTLMAQALPNQERTYDLNLQTGSIEFSPLSGTFNNQSVLSPKIQGADSVEIRSPLAFCRENDSDIPHLTLIGNWYVMGSDSPDGTPGLTIGEGATLTAVDDVIQTNFIVKNEGKVVSSGKTEFSTLVLADQGQFESNGKDKGQQLILLGGTYNLLQNADAEFDVLKTSDKTVNESTGKIINNGKLTINSGELGKGATLVNSKNLTIKNVTVAGTLTNTSTVNVEGDLSVSGEFTSTGGTLNGTNLIADGGTVSIANTDLSTLSTITNKGNVTLDSVKGLTLEYVQSGTSQLTVSDGSWFSGAKLTYQDGAVATLDTLGNNVVTVKGPVKPTINQGQPNTGKFTGMTTVTLNTLSNDGSVRIAEGGFLKVKKLTGQANATLNGGVIELALNDVSEFYLDGSTLDKDENVEIESDKFGRAHFDDSKLTGITLTSGIVSLDSARTETLDTIVTIADGFSKKSANVMTVFNGSIAGAVDGNFKTDTIKDLFEEQKGQPNSPVMNPGVALTQYSLDAEGQAVVFSKTKQNGIAGSIGFKSIINSDSVTVEDGLTTSLTGSEGSLDWSDAQKLLVNANDGGKVTVTDGRVIFGNGATGVQHTGWIGSLDSTDKGQVEVKNFELGVKQATLNGKTTIAANATLMADTINIGNHSELTNNGKVRTGTIADNETFALAGKVLGNGTWDLSAIETTTVTGSAQMGNLQAQDVIIAQNGYLEIADTENGNALTIQAGASHIATGNLTWDSVKVDETGTDIWGSDNANDKLSVKIKDYTTAGKLDASKAETVVFEGNLTSSGTTIFKNLDLKGDLSVNGGTFEVASLQTQSGSNLVVSEGVLALNGMTADAVRKASSQKAIIGLGETLNLNGGSLTVGTVSTGDQVSANDAYFGHDSALVLDTSKYASNKVLTSTGKLTVKKGSQLVVTNASWGKHMIVTDGMDLSGMETDAWMNDDLVNQTKAHMNLVVQNGNLMLNVGKPGDTAIGSLSHNFIAPNVINGLIDTEEGAKIRDVNSPFADVAFIDRMLDVNYVGALADGSLDLANALEKMNSVIGLNAATGMDAYAHNLISDKMDRVDHHMHQTIGQLDRNFWVDLIGSKMKSKSLALGATNTGFDADNHGFIFGADVNLKPNIRLGAAFNYVDGDVESLGDVVKTKTDAKTYGLTAYGSYNHGQLRLLAQMGYDETKGHASQSFVDVKQEAYRVTGNTKAKTFSLGLTGEYSIDYGAISLVPHAGLRFTHAQYDGFTTHINGKKAFANNVEDTNIIQMPVGLSVMTVLDKNGWILVPNADLSVVPQFGDTASSVEVSAMNFNGTDSYSYDITGDVVGKMSFGVNAEKGSHRIGVNVGVSAGDKGARSTTLSLDYRLAF